MFIYFTIEALAEVLHKSQMTVKTALAVLEKQELIFRKRQGPGQPNRIYIKLPKETIHYTDRKLSGNWKDYIERLSGYMASTGKQYQDHAATIISWARQDHPTSQQRNYESEEYETL